MLLEIRRLQKSNFYSAKKLYNGLFGGVFREQKEAFLLEISYIALLQLSTRATKRTKPTRWPFPSCANHLENLLQRKVDANALPQGGRTGGKEGEGYKHTHTSHTHIRMQRNALEYFAAKVSSRCVA